MTDHTDILSRPPIMRSTLTADIWPDPSDDWTGENLIRNSNPKPDKVEPPAHLIRRAIIAKMFNDGAALIDIFKAVNKRPDVVKDDLRAMGLLKKREYKAEGDYKLALKIITEFCERNNIAEQAMIGKGFLDPATYILRGDCALEVKEACAPNGQMLVKIFGRSAQSVRKSILAAFDRRAGA